LYKIIIIFLEGIKVIRLYIVQQKKRRVGTMKTYSDLTEEQRKKAVEKDVVSLLTEIIEGGIRFNDKINGDDLQARIDKAALKADQMKTPWFVHEYIMETCREDIESMAVASAEDALYPELGEHVICGVV